MTDHADEQRLLEQTRTGAALPMPRARRRSHLVASGLFLLVSVPMALLLDDPGMQWRAGTTVALVIAYAVAARVQFEVGHGFTDATALIFVPMLFLAPAPFVPLLVALGFLLAELPDYVTGRVHWDRAIGVPGNCWYAVGPAVVFAVFDAGAPDWGHWPVYLLALAAQFGGDAFAAAARNRRSRDVPVLQQLQLMTYMVPIDAGLACAGLLAAFATTTGEYAFLLLLPLALLLQIFAGEREARLTGELELARERQRALEAELSASRGREEVLAALSHGLQTPLSGVVGLSGTLVRSGSRLDPERLSTVHLRLHADALRLRHRIRQVLDYRRLRSLQPVAVRPSNVDLATIAREVAATTGTDAVPVVVDAPEEAGVPVRVDKGRMAQILTALIENAVAVTPADGEVVVSVVPASGDGDGAARARVTVTDLGPGVPVTQRAGLFAEPAPERGQVESEGTGIGLYVAASLAAAMDSTLTAEFPDGGGSRFVLEVPAA